MGLAQIRYQDLELDAKFLTIATQQSKLRSHSATESFWNAEGRVWRRLGGAAVKEPLQNGIPELAPAASRPGWLLDA